MTKEGTKHRASNNKSNAEVDTFLKNQQNVIARLKSELASVIGKSQLSANGTVEMEKYIQELEQSIGQRDAEINKLNSNLNQFKEENSKILLEFNFFKEKFCQLEIDYDRNMNVQSQEIENLRSELEQQEHILNHQLQELSARCQDLQKQLHDNINETNRLNTHYVETKQKFEALKVNYERQRNEFELYKKQVSEENRLNEEKNKHEFDKHTAELKQKDEVIKQCIADKNLLEKEKNLAIDELNNKITRIERAFSQPMKLVQPMLTLNEQINSSDNNSNSECSNDNVATSLDNVPVQTLANKENQKVEQNQMQRNYKFKRPAQLPTSSQQQKSVANRKLRNKPLRQHSTIKTYNEFLSSSDNDADDDDNESYSNFSKQLWHPPSNECYIDDTDTSEGFGKPKRQKK